jgi:hypothetical protein
LYNEITNNIKIFVDKLFLLFLVLKDHTGGLLSTSAACYALNNQYISMTLIKNTHNKICSYFTVPHICKSNELNDIPNKKVSYTKEITVQPTQIK